MKSLVGYFPMKLMLSMLPALLYLIFVAHHLHSSQNPTSQKHSHHSKTMTWVEEYALVHKEARQKKRLAIYHCMNRDEGTVSLKILQFICF